MSNKNAGDEVGGISAEEENAIPLETTVGPPPSYDSVVDAETDEDEDESSVRLLQGQNDGAVGGPENAEGGELSKEEKRQQHDRKIKKLIADLRRECSVEEVAPEEIEMTDSPALDSSKRNELNVGDDALNESDLSSVPSSARPREEEQLGASAAANDGAESKGDHMDASLRRFSKRSSALHMSSDNDVDVNVDADADAGVNNSDVEHPRDEVSVEDGEERPKRSGIFALLEGSPTRKLIVAITVLFCLGLLLLVILLPKSFVYVEYHEYALSRNTWTEAVDYSTVYDGGCYLLAPQDELIRFDATAHFVKQSLDIMDNTGLSIKIDLTLQYFLKRDELPQLFQKYHLGYDEVMNSLVESAVKNAAVKFTLVQYRLHRQEVEATILKRVRHILSGDCCDTCCPDKCGGRKVECSSTACRPVGSCQAGYHIIIKYFQLGAITIPESVMNRHTQKVVLQVEADRELYYQRKAIEVKKTEQIAKDIRNKAEELKQVARAQAKVIRMKAEAEKSLIVEKTQQKALRKVFSDFNITDQEVKLSYIYAHALANKRDNIHYTNAYHNLAAFSP